MRSMHPGMIDRQMGNNSRFAVKPRCRRPLPFAISIQHEDLIWIVAPENDWEVSTFLCYPKSHP